jgi:pyruvate kinase
VAVTPEVVRKLSMNWGVTAILCESGNDDEQKIAFAIRRGCEAGFLQRGDVVVATAGISQESGSTNMITIVTVDE